MKQFEKYIGILMLIFAIGFNLWIYRLEPTAQTDPNDNTFQYALVDRTNQIWDFANKSCPKNLSFVMCHVSFLSDHWVPNWAEGYNLPYYYSHAPQIVIVSSYRLLSLFTSHVSLFTYYHWITYLLLSFFPLSLFLALLIVGLSPLTAGFGALIATQISTDGLYGLDPSSFLWRGYGLTSQLYAMVFFPLAIAYAWRFLHITEKFSITNVVSRNSKTQIPNSICYIPSVLFLAATTAGHLGIGIIAFLSAGVITISPTIQAILSNQWDENTWKQLQKNIIKLLWLFGGVGLLLGYWILPILKDGNFHNTSVWDPIWKFDSYGYREILKNFFNGDLFDFGRLPMLTGLVFVGLFAVFRKNIQHLAFGMLFVFWLLMYFGTTTWGSILYLIPGMRDFHISRFIVGVHMAGLFLIPIGMEWVVSQMPNDKRIRVVVYLLIGVFVYLIITPQTISYASNNDFLIRRANTNYTAVKADSDLLFTTLRTYEVAQPGRVFAGRGGSWGKELRVAETPYYMYLSTYGIPTVLWLPETWSPNSDTEQYFRENYEADYSLYNIRYVVTPAKLSNGELVEPQPFWRLLAASKTWKLYGVGSVIPSAVEGYITTGIRPAIVSTAKENYLNVVRLWIQSDFPKEKLYPELTFDKNYPVNSGLPNFRMTDEVTYKVPDGSLHDLFAENPNYVAPTGKKFVTPNVISQSDNHDMIFSAKVDAPKGCTDCLVILKQSFHPSWQVTIDGKSAPTFAVFPFYTAVRLDAPGTHEIVFSYHPSVLKVSLLIVSLLTLGILFWLACANLLKKWLPW